MVETEDDPAPVVLVVATTLRRAEETPKLAGMMRRARGNVALRSTVDPQAATIRFTSAGVRVERGVAADAHVTIATDLDAMADERPPKPKLSGAARHLRLALTAARVLDPPKGPWSEEANRFWSQIADRPGVPTGIRVVCTDDGTDLVLGSAPAAFEIHGSAHRLVAVFSGSTVFGQEVVAGKLHAVGTLEHLAELTGASLAVMMGC